MNRIKSPRRAVTAWLAGTALGLLLVTLGWWSTPGVNPLSVAGPYVILAVYGGLGSRLASRLDSVYPRLPVRLGLVGLAAGAIFLCEVALEYIVLPADNSMWGIVEYGGVFLLIFTGSLIAAARAGQFRQGVVAGFGIALVASLMFISIILAFFYAFRGTPRQAQVFQAEGNYADYAHSGAQDFNIFIMEDFFGAVFFHSILLPLVGALLGALGGFAGKGLARLTGRMHIKVVDS